MSPNANKPHVLPRSSTMVDRLNRLYQVFHGDDKVLIVISADPDAIASAMALKRLLWRRVAAVTVARINIIKRADNQALISFLKMPMILAEQVNPNLYTRLATVDSQPSHLPGFADRVFDVIIDHHPLTSYQALFCDVRPDYGATATIMTEYLRAAKITPSRGLATALYYAIKTDTNNFVRQGQLEDVRAFRFLFPLKSQSAIAQIEHGGITRGALRYFRRAFKEVKLFKDAALIFLGVVDNPDTLVILADFFLRVRTINRSIAAGVYQDKLVVIFRVTGARKNAGHMAEKALGALGSAGGHRSMARAEVPLANLDIKLQAKNGAMVKFLQKRLEL